MKQHLLGVLFVVLTSIVVSFGCSNTQDINPGATVFVTDIQGRLVDGNGDPISAATIWIPCDGNVCGNFFSRSTQANRNANHSTTCRTPPNDGNTQDGNDWFVGTCTDDDNDTDDGVEIGEFHGLACPPGTTADTVSANIILPETGFAEATDSFQFRCSGATGDVELSATPTPAL